MDALIGVLGFFGMIGCIPVYFVKKRKKQSKKKVGITFLVCLAMFAIALSMSDANVSTETPPTLEPTITSAVGEFSEEQPNKQSEPDKSNNDIIVDSSDAEPSPAQEDTEPVEPTAEPSATTTPLPTETPIPEQTEKPAPTATPTPTPAIVQNEENAEDSILKSFSVTYLNVGQGDAAVIECNGQYMLIDGGDKEYSDMMYSYLKTNGISKLDIVVGTHAHADHVGGLAGALNYAKADLVLCPVTENDTKAFNDFKKYAEKNGPGITVPKVGDTYKLGAADVEILGLNAGDGNDTSIILTVTVEDNCFLFTGDAERDAELAVLDRLELPEMVVLKVGHHGSDTSSSYQFLRKVMPVFAVISCGADNSYGHPTSATLSKLRDAETVVFRTDLNGDVIFEYDGEQWYVGYEHEVSEDEIMVGRDGLTNIPEQPEEEEEITTTNGHDYIGNKNSKVFHYTDCSSVKRMNESNKVFFNNTTREEVIAKGYKPCGNCNP